MSVYKGPPGISAVTLPLPSPFPLHPPSLVRFVSVGVARTARTAVEVELEEECGRRGGVQGNFRTYFLLLQLRPAPSCSGVAVMPIVTQPVLDLPPVRMLVLQVASSFFGAKIVTTGKREGLEKTLTATLYFLNKKNTMVQQGTARYSKVTQ